MKIEELVKYVQPEVPGCPDPNIERAIVFTADEFLRYSHAWNVTSDPFVLEDGVSDYDIDIMPGSLPISVSKVWTQSLELAPVTMDQLALVLPNWQTATSTEPRYYNMVKGFGTMTVYPIPAEPLTTQLTVQAVYTIKNTSTTVPDQIVDHYLETISAGAKARLMLMPGVAWSNPQLAAMYRQQFAVGMSNARIETMKSRTPGSMRVRPIAFGRPY